MQIWFKFLFYKLNISLMQKRMRNWSKSLCDTKLKSKLKQKLNQKASQSDTKQSTTKAKIIFAKNKATQNQFSIHKLTRNGLNNLISHWVSHSSTKLFFLFVTLSKKKFSSSLGGFLCCYKLISYFLLFIIFLLFFNKLDFLLHKWIRMKTSQLPFVTYLWDIICLAFCSLVFYKLFVCNLYLKRKKNSSSRFTPCPPAALALVILSQELATSVWISFRLLFRFIFLSFFPSLDFSHLCITNGQEHIKITSLIFEKIRTL